MAEQQTPFSPLVADIITAQFAQTRAATDAVVDGLQRQVAKQAAVLYAIQTGVSRLLAGPYMPMPEAIRAAVFYPDQNLIDEYEANKEVGW